MADARTEVITETTAVGNSIAHIERIVADQSLRFAECVRLSSRLAENAGKYLEALDDENEPGITAYLGALSRALVAYEASQAGGFLPDEQ